MAKQHLRGMNQVMKALNKEVEAIKGRSLEGLIVASIIIRRSMEDTSPKIPVDFGNLRSSWFTVTSTGAVESGGSPSFEGNNANELGQAHSQALSHAQGLAEQPKVPTVVFGFGANYAVKVHEEVDAQFKRPGSGAKFLEAAIKRNKKQILEIIRKYATIK